jgi:hypothetical protein
MLGFKSRSILMGLVAVLALGASHAAFAGHTSWSVGVGIGGPGYYGGFGYHSGYYGHYYRPYYYRPYYYPAPVYVAPSVVYVDPPPQTTVVYQQPAPQTTVVYQPAPQTAAPQQYTYGYSTPAPANTAQTTVYNPPPYQSNTQPAQVSAPMQQQPAAMQPSQPGGNFQPPQQPYADGWALLSTDQARTALDAFAIEAERNPSAGAPKVGYALASVVIGDDAKAVWAMRQALQSDPNSLNQALLAASAHNQLRQAIGRYDSRIAGGFSRADDLFMVAALRYIEADYANADQALSRAVQLGDNTPSTTALRSLIDAKMRSAPAAGAAGNVTGSSATTPVPLRPQP